MQLVFLFQSFSLVAAIASLLGSTEEQEEEEEEIEESSIQRATCYWLIIRLEVGQDRCAYSAFKALWVWKSLRSSIASATVSYLYLFLDSLNEV